MDDDTRFQELKEKEITRLTTPASYPKIGNLKFKIAGARDCEGNPVPVIRGFRNRFALEPKPGLLSDDEILMYAPESKEASKIRLKRGLGTNSDKSTVNGDLIYILSISAIILFIIGLFALIFGKLIVKLLFVFILLIITGIYIYVMFIKDYTEPKYKQTTEKLNKISSKKDEDEKNSANDELLLLFESKERIAREMIEKKFPAPQMTNAKFNAVIDECKKEVESQISVLNALTVTEKTKYEIESRKELIKQLINKMDDLTNELILCDENHIEEAIEDMDDLISSVKEYE